MWQWKLQTWKITQEQIAAGYGWPPNLTIQTPDGSLHEFTTFVSLMDCGGMSKVAVTFLGLNGVGDLLRRAERMYYWLEVMRKRKLDVAKFEQLFQGMRYTDMLTPTQTSYETVVGAITDLANSVNPGQLLIPKDKLLRGEVIHYRAIRRPVDNEQYAPRVELLSQRLDQIWQGMILFLHAVGIEEDMIRHEVWKVVEKDQRYHNGNSTDYFGNI